MYEYVPLTLIPPLVSLSCLGVQLEVERGAELLVPPNQLLIQRTYQQQT